VRPLAIIKGSSGSSSSQRLAPSATTNPQSLSGHLGHFIASAPPLVPRAGSGRKKTVAGVHYGLTRLFTATHRIPIVCICFLPFLRKRVCQHYWREYLAVRIYHNLLLENILRRYCRRTCRSYDAEYRKRAIKR